MIRRNVLSLASCHEPLAWLPRTVGDWHPSFWRLYPSEEPDGARLRSGTGTAADGGASPLGSACSSRPSRVSRASPLHHQSRFSRKARESRANNEIRFTRNYAGYDELRSCCDQCLATPLIHAVGSNGRRTERNVREETSRRNRDSTSRNVDSCA